MSETFPLTAPLPDAGEPAVRIVRKLVGAGHTALLAGGCVRDLLLDARPQDFDVATDAAPERVCEIFPKTRKVGAQFGVVLVRQGRCWVEVATFRADSDYINGRRPVSVTFCDARRDALRRDFTVNGMFLDPLGKVVIDYVGGRADLRAKLIRAIGEPAARFAEDHLRLLRAVRFAARLSFPIEPVTFDAVSAHAARLADVATERVREELEKMLAQPTRGAAVALLHDTRLLPHLWKDAVWTTQQVKAALSLLERLPDEAKFEPAFAALVADRKPQEINSICRQLAFSNEQRAATVWLARHQADLDDAHAEALPPAALKRLMANRSFAALHAMAQARFRAMPDGAQRAAALERRVSAIAPESVQPPPFVTGDDLIARAVPQGPVYQRILNELYTRQLNETLGSRAEALRALEELLAGRRSE